MTYHRKRLSTTAVTILVGLAPLCGLAQLADTGGIDSYLSRQVVDTQVPGVVALVTSEDEILYEGAFGLRSAAGNQPMTADTIFRIASMTKPVAATVIMMLVEEGKLALDDPIARYVPKFAERQVVASFDTGTGAYTTRPAATDATIRQLLSHSSGLAYPFASDIVTRISESGDPPAADTFPLLYDPGTAWSYAGGIAIVGAVAESIEGKGLDSIMHERLFEPLGMDDTSFIVPRAKHGRVAPTFRLDASGDLIEAPNPPDIRAGVSGDGGLHSTARDYAKFIRLFLNDGIAPDGTRLLSQRSIREMGRNQLDGRTVTLMDEPTPFLARAFPLGADRDGFGLGFQITGPHADAVARSPGSLSWAGIFNTEFWIDPARDIGGVLLMQYLPFYDADAIETLIGFEERVYSRID